MNQSARLCAVLFAAVLVLATGAAQAASGDGSAPRSTPVETILDTYREAHGYSFIFDSRLVERAMAAPVDPRLSPEDALRQSLQSAGLSLRKVSAGAYAIVRAPDEPPTPFVLAGPDRDAAPIETILVIGAAPVQNATAGSRRIFDIDADELAYMSATSPAEAIYDLPQSLASFTPSNTALFGATAGISLADLRGLQPKRTMVLVNGRRRTLTTGGNGDIGGVDLNSIAEPLLERIEVESLPGGARHGPGAIAGAVNFVTRTGVDGLEGGARLGISEEGDSEEISLHALGGGEIGGIGNLTVGLNATRVEGLIGADRSFSAVPFGFARNGRKASPPDAAFLPGFGGTTTTGRGLIGGVVLADGSFAAFPNGASYLPNTDGSIERFVASLDQLHNWAASQNVVLPNDRLLGLASFSADIAAGWRVFAEAQAGLSATDNRLAPLPGVRIRGVDPVAGDAAVIPLSNPFMPQSVRDLVAASFGASATGVVYDHRYLELGPRRQQIDRRYVDLVAGVETEGDADPGLSFAYRFSHNRVVTRDADRLDRNRLQIALDAPRCAAEPGCAPVDFFTRPEISPEAIEFVVIPEIRRTIAVEEHEAVATATAPLRIKEGFDGRIDGGVEIRRTILSDRDEIPAGAAPIGYLGGADNRGSLDQIEVYADAQSPLVRATGLPGEVDGSLAFRAARSSQSGLSLNFEAALDWRPVDGVAFFTRQHIGERPPDVLELYTVGPTLETSFLDPCGLSPARQEPVVQANCASTGPLGVTAPFVQISPLASQRFYGNPDLRPEKVRSAAYGVTLSPGEARDALGRLQLTATWLDFEIRDAITEFSDSLGACYLSPSFSSPACGVNPRTGAPAIIRDPVTRQVASIDGLLHNAGSLSWRGLDIELRYAAQPPFLPALDAIWISALHTYTDRVSISYADGETERLDGLIDFPRHRSLVSVGADAGRWSLVVFGSRRGEALTRRVAVPEARVPAAFYLDTTLRFDVTDRAFIQASVKNITDKEPAITAYNDVGNFAPEYYDPVGRRYALSVRVNF